MSENFVGGVGVVEIKVGLGYPHAGYIGQFSTCFPADFSQD